MIAAMGKAEISKEEFTTRVDQLTLKGFSRKEVAGKLGISIRALNYYINGERSISIVLLRSLELLEKEYADSPNVGAKGRGRPSKLKE